MTDKEPHPNEIDHQTFDHFTHGLATGEWQPFLDILTEDFTFWFPVGPYQGLGEDEMS